MISNHLIVQHCAYVHRSPYLTCAMYLAIVQWHLVILVQVHQYHMISSVGIYAHQSLYPTCVMYHIVVQATGPSARCASIISLYRDRH